MKRNLLFDSFVEIIHSSEAMPIIIKKLNEKAKEIIKEFDAIMANHILLPSIFYGKEEAFIFFKQQTTSSYTKELLKFAFNILLSPKVTFTYENLKKLTQLNESLLLKTKQAYFEKKDFVESFFDAELSDAILRKKITQEESMHKRLIDEAQVYYIASFNHNNFAFLKEFLLKIPFVIGIEIDFIAPYSPLKKYDGLVSFMDHNITYLINDFFPKTLLENTNINIGDIEKILKNLKLNTLNKYVVIFSIYMDKNITKQAFKLNSLIEYLKRKKIFLSNQEQLIGLNENNLITLFI